jgi:hypothetical protein
LGAAAAICAVLAGCGLGNSAQSLLADPGAYDAYNCKDLITEWGTLNKREEQLRNLMSKASQSGSSTAIGSLTYGPDYQTVLAQKKLVQQAAAEENCELVATFKSDQSIR